MYDLTGKVALVTGAGGERGIGRGIANRLADEGADVAVSDLRDSPIGSWGGLSAVAREIEGKGRGSMPITADVGDEEQVNQLIGSVVERFGKLDILVNNAGAPAGPDRVPVVDLDVEVWDAVQRVNVRGTFLCARAAARHMIERGGGGKIINMSSVSGKKGSPRYAAYCASKFAVIGFTQSLSGELGPYGIQVNAICPGLIETERLTGMAGALRPDGVSTEVYREQMIARAGDGNPVGRIGQPDDVARTAVFLASEESTFLTGLAIPVAGGSWML
jgi:NAD(P)-dependent dehydrogenase (short-subunit alcohol dehydrogenase family)